MGAHAHLDRHRVEEAGRRAPSGVQGHPLYKLRPAKFAAVPLLSAYPTSSTASTRLWRSLAPQAGLWTLPPGHCWPCRTRLCTW